jgi:Rrf2 family nitric oxide-sensitive transcriptional repressor
VRDLERDQALVECFRVDGGGCTLTAECRLRNFIGDAREEFYRRLDQHTIADCLPKPRDMARTKMSMARSTARGG